MKCIYHAIRLFATKGGYIWMRKSKDNRFIPHFGWSKGVTGSEHWQPDTHLVWWKELIHMFFARGKVKKGD